MIMTLLFISKFLSTLSLRRATVSVLCATGAGRYFYPRSPCGERPASLWLDWLFPEFLSTLSLRRATNVRSNGDNRSRISIHALLAESDSHRKGRPSQLCKISIHALLAESDSASLWLDWLFPEFLSTLSLRRATWQRGSRITYVEISIHALLAESDPPVRDVIQWEGIFLSTLSLRRATPPSITPTASRRYFYPRSPCGERPGCMNINPPSLIISIHALLAESDGTRIYT